VGQEWPYMCRVPCHVNPHVNPAIVTRMRIREVRKAWHTNACGAGATPVTLNDSAEAGCQRKVTVWSARSLCPIRRCQLTEEVASIDQIPCPEAFSEPAVYGP
jgi:hypothetical protein